MEFRLLGPLEVSERGRLVPLGGPKQRAVLAHLLIRANQVVATDRLIDEIWGEQPPEGARNALQSYVSRLRTAFGNGVIEGRPPGYVLHVDPADVDALRFEALIREAHDSLESDPEHAAAELRKALTLWRGPALADLATELSLRSEIARLEDLRLVAIEDRIAAELALGQHAERVGELESLVEIHPLRERLWSQLMLALYRSGRQAEALSTYQRARGVLTEELGIDPSLELQELQRQILVQDPALDLERTRLRGYELVEQIGEGSFGVVYRARQPGVGRDVAVKVIQPRLANDPAFVRRFEAEAQLVARLEHPHIVPLYDYWREPDAAYLVMRLLRGGSLGATLGEGQLPPDRAARIVEQVAGGLAAAHRQGIVHRDVKPANILLDEEGNAYLSDFGIAREAARGTDAESDELGTSPYLSPEQLRGEPATPQSDVYSLGMVVGEAITDQSRAVADVIRRATAEEPSSRYRDAQHLAHDLTAALVLAEPTRPATIVVTNPYKGLRPFQEADAHDFFGREAFIEHLTLRLSDPGTRFIAVVGPSGSGKSSLVRAGLVPALRQGTARGSQDWFVAEMVPGARPLEELEEALLQIAVTPQPRMIDELERDEYGLLRVAKAIVPAESELLLVVDQFEETFTLVEDEERRLQFLRSLVVAASDPETPLRVVLTLRADFYDRPLRHQGLAELMRRGTESVVPLTSDELERAITHPAERIGARAEPGLAAQIVADVSDQPGSLPLLQYTLTELFEQRRDGVLTLDAYKAIGGVSGALVRRAEEIYGRLDEESSAATRQLFLRLVTLGEGTEDARRRVPQDEVLSLETHRDAMQSVIDSFGRYRLLSFDRDRETRAPTVEVAHEALLHEWGRLRGWIDAARDDVRMHRRLAAETSEWVGSERDPSFLLRGSRLEQLATWAESSQLALTSSEREYLGESVAAGETEEAAEVERREREAALERRSIRRLRALVAVLGVAVIIAVGLTIFAFTQREEAQRQTKRAELEAARAEEEAARAEQQAARAEEETLRAEEQARVATARELASASVANLDANPELSLLLALEAAEVTRAIDESILREAEEALHQAVQANRVVLSVPGFFGASFSPDGTQLATSQNGTATVWDVSTGEELLTLPGHDDRLIAVEFTPDGNALATTSFDQTARLWDSRTGEELQTFRGHTDGVLSMDVSDDGSIMITRSFDGTAKIWNLTSGDELLTIDLGEALGLHFSPDSTRVAIGGGSGGARVFDVATGDEVLAVGSDVIDVRFSPDGTLLAATQGDSTAKLWDVETGQELLTLTGHEGSVETVDFSPDGTHVATGSLDGTVRLWETATGRPVLVLSGQGSAVEHLTFSPDGTLLVGAGTSGTTKVWDITPAGSREVALLSDHDGPVFTVSYSPDGSLLASAGEDGNVKVYDTASTAEVLTLADHGGPVFEALFSPDGGRLITGGVDGTAKTYEADSGDELLTLAGHPAPVAGLAVTTDGDRLATAGADGVSKVWDAVTGENLLSLVGHVGVVFNIAISPDGTRLATGSQDETVKVWDAETGEELLSLTAHSNNIIDVAFSPDGQQLASVGLDGTARLWNPDTGEELFTLTAHTGAVMGVAYSPDGASLATASQDGTAKIWDPTTGEERLTLAGHTAGAFGVGFSPDGTELAVSGEDGTVRVFALDTDELIALARSRVTRALTDQECRQYLRLESCPPS